MYIYICVCMYVESIHICTCRGSSGSSGLIQARLRVDMIIGTIWLFLGTWGAFSGG